MKKMETSNSIKLKGTKRLFLKLGSCSRTLGFILDREFGHLQDAHERALDPLAGGIIQQGYQCGMLWGSAMAIGAESYRKSENQEKATALAIKATQNVMNSFIRRANSPDCGEITNCNWDSKASIAKYMVTGKVFSCFKLLENWAPEAIAAAHEGLSAEPSSLAKLCISCASEVAKKMGATKEEQLMVAGFAGGLGLSGNACGALGAAIWMQTLALCKAQPGKSFYNNPDAKKIVEEFYKTTDYNILCRDITGKQFLSLDDHSEFIRDGGCDKLINALASKQALN